MALTMNLTKAGDAKPNKLSLNLKKTERFKVRLSWGGDTDLDLHAFHCINDGTAAKVESFDDILSTYNVKRKIAGSEVGTLVKAADGTFSIHGGAMIHSADALSGGADDGADDEFVMIDPSKLTPKANAAIEIPLIAMIHPQSGPNKFKNVTNPRVIIEDGDGKSVFDANLSAQFGDFVGVQMGSIIIDPSNTISFYPVAVGFDQDFNEVLGHFS
jgi:tellurium resistance protein TerD